MTRREAIEELIDRACNRNLYLEANHTGVYIATDEAPFGPTLEEIRHALGFGTILAKDKGRNVGGLRLVFCSHGERRAPLAVRKVRALLRDLLDDARFCATNKQSYAWQYLMLLRNVPEEPNVFVRRI